MDTVELEDIGLINGTATFGNDLLTGSQPVVYTQDMQSILNTDDLSGYGNRVAYVSIPIQIVQDPQSLISGYIIDNSQIPILNRSVIVSQDNVLDVTSSLNQDLIAKQFLNFVPQTSSITSSTSSDGNSTDKTIIAQNVPDDFPESSQDLLLSSDDVEPPDRSGPLVCAPCGVHFTSLKLYKRHKLAHRSDKPFECNQCSESFNYESNLKLHLATHNVSNPYCPECKKSFNRVASLKAHLMLHEREESLFCLECGDEFSNQLFLEEHMREHRTSQPKSPRQYRCSKCDSKFLSISQLKEHSKEYHKGKVIKRPKKRRRGAHVCDFCSKSFQKPSQLSRHKRIHTGEKPFKCHLCSRAFNQKGSLQIHMLKHNGLRPYICQFCNSAFSQKGNLQAHIQRLHVISSSDRVHTCGQCSCVFRKLGSLNAHITRVHGFLPQQESLMHTVQTKVEVCKAKDIPSGKDSSDKENDVSKLPPKLVTITNLLVDGSVHKQTVQQRKVNNIKWHKCTYCSSEFKRPSDLARHIRIHTREKPYKCKLCFRGFALRSTLNSHMRTHMAAKNYPCDVCKKSFANQSSLNVHKKSHINVVSEPDESAIVGTNLNMEGIQENLQSSVIQIGNLEIQLPECIVVPKSGKYTEGDVNGLKESLELDEVEDSTKAEDPERPFSCDVCSAAFKRSSHLKVHMRSHTGERPYACKECGSAFVSSSVLKAHMVTHSGIKDHKCEECGRAFSCVGSLRRHSETHTPGHMYGCPVCSKPYKSFAACTKHIQSHTPPEGIMLKWRPVPLGKQKSKTLSVDDNGMLSIISNSPPHIEEVEEEEEEEEPPIADDGAVRYDSGLQSDLCDLIRSLQPGQQFTLTANGIGGLSVTAQPVQSTSSDVTPLTMTQDNIPEDSFGEFDDRINQQLFGALNGQKESIFEQGLDGSVFLQNEQLEVNSPVIATNLASILNSSDLPRSSGCGDTLAMQKDKDLQVKGILHTCFSCRNDFSTIADFEEHLKEGSCHFDPQESDIEFEGLLPDASVHKCHKCDVDFATSDELCSHLSFHIQANEYTCTTCKISFNSLVQLQEHLKVHKQSIGERGSDRDDDQLVEEVHESDKIGLELIESEMSNRGDVVRGKRKTKRRRSIARRLTEEETRALASLQPNSASISERVLLQSIMEKECNDQLEGKDEIEEKVQVHANKCKYCPKSFRKPSDLVRHLRTHTGERPYMCPCCNKCFTVKSTASSHMKTHTKDRSYKCHICSKLFSTTGSLKVHMRLHTGSKPFVCPFPQCGARFRTSGHKKAHFTSHEKHMALLASKGTYCNEANKKSIRANGNTDFITSVPDTNFVNVVPKEMPALSADSAIVDAGGSSKYIISLSKSDQNLSEIFSGKLPDNGQYIIQSINSNINDDRTQFVVTFNEQDPTDSVQDAYRAVLQKSGVISDSENQGIDDDIPDVIGVPKFDTKIDSILHKPEPVLCKKPSLKQGNCANNNKFTCKVCKKIFTKRFTYETHIKKCQARMDLNCLVDDNFECVICLDKFATRTELELHALEHELEPVWMCTNCDLSFRDQDGLHAHKCAACEEIKQPQVTIKTPDLHESSTLDLGSDVNDFFLFPNV